MLQLLYMAKIKAVTVSHTQAAVTINAFCAFFCFLYRNSLPKLQTILKSKESTFHITKFSAIV